MKTIKRLAGAFGVLALTISGALALASPAQADDEHYPDAGWLVQDTTIGPDVDWSDCDPGPTRSDAAQSAVTGPTTVELVGTGTSAPPHYGTSIETADLGLPAAIGTVVSVDYELDGADPAGGAVRLFVYDHADGDTDCEGASEFVAAPDDGTTSGTLTIRVDWDGVIGTLGAVYDSSNNGAGGTVVFSNLRVDDLPVLFEEPETPPTTEPTSEPTAEPSEEPTPGATASPEAQLPVTGTNLLVPALVIAAVFGIAGVAIYLAARRRPTSFTSD